VKRLAIALVIIAVLLPAPIQAQAVTVTLPIEGYFERQSVKGFGTLVDPAFHERHRDLFPNNQFANQFTGYHAGVDVEFSGPADQARMVSVWAIAPGDVVFVGDVAGYGGVVVIRHPEPESVTSLYGHLRLRDLQVRLGDRVAAGQVIGYLGDQFSAETSGARKHLHFAIHRGEAVDLAGHEASPQALQSKWYNPNDWLAGHLTIRASGQPTPAAEPPPKPRPLFARIIDFLKHLFQIKRT
jgi:murein DD-endopeptidase MepM/ murein hydrolase activator NlpD